MQTQEEDMQMPDPDSFEQDPQVITVWQILRARLLLIAGLAVLGMIMGLVISLLLPKMYTSIATVEVSKQSPPSATVNNSVGAPVDFQSLDEMNADELTLQQELESASISLGVIETAGLSAEEPYKKITQMPVHSPEDVHKQQEQMLALFQSHLKIDLVKDTKLMTVTFTDGNPERAAQVANLVIDTYLRSYAEARNATVEKTSVLLSTQLTDLRQQVLDSEKKVNEYKERNKIVGTEDLGSNTRPDANLNSDAVVIDRFVELNHELTSAEVELVAKEALAATVMNQGADTVLEALQQQEQTNGLAGEAAFAGSEYNALTALRQQRSELGLQLANRTQYLGAASPQIKQLQSEVAVADEQLRAELARIQLHVKGDLQLARATEAGLRKLVQASQNAVTALNVHTNQLHLLQQEAQSKRALYQDLFTKLQQENAYKGMNAATVTLIDPARAPIMKSSPKTLRNGVTGLVLGGLAGVLLAFVQSPGSLFMLLVVLALSRPSQAQGTVGLSANIEQLQGTATRQTSQPSQLPGIPLGITNSLLGPGFLVHLDVFGVPEMSMDLRVDKDGNILAPLLGPVHVEGLSQTQAASMLADKYIAAHLLQKDSQITLTLLQYSTIGVVILGEVQSPGLVQMTAPATLEKALAMVGGETIAAGNIIQLQHRDQNITDIPFPRGQGLQASLNTPVNDGDSVYVRKAGVIYVLGSVARPGGYIMVDQGGMNILEAISLAQGTTIVASLGTVYIIRPGENGTYQTIPIPYKKITQGKANPVALLARDILYVPNSLTKTILVNGSSLIGAAATTTVYAVRGP